MEKNLNDRNRETREAWELNAEVWDNRMGDDGNDFFNVLCWPALASLLDLKPDSHILDIACGNGLTTRRLAELGAQALQKVAERQFGIRVAHRDEASVQYRRKALEVAVVGKDPVAAPKFALEGMGVLQRDAALRGLADVRDDVAALDRVAPHHLGHRRIARALRIAEDTRAAPLEEGDAEAVLVLLGAGGEAGEAEHHVGGRVGVQAEELAHGGRYSVKRR